MYRIPGLKKLQLMFLNAGQENTEETTQEIEIL
ncbi:hypothetical protein CI610_02848 [invertebrate metagenome]|uniref:Uncharacterized protein n=1 Tax=invertebrate metagenome TaxID=1711999 RepID=A0A2H9T4T6_9ZZZZ